MDDPVVAPVASYNKEDIPYPKGVNIVDEDGRFIPAGLDGIHLVLERASDDYIAHEVPIARRRSFGGKDGAPVYYISHEYMPFNSVQLEAVFTSFLPEGTTGRVVDFLHQKRMEIVIALADHNALYPRTKQPPIPADE